MIRIIFAALLIICAVWAVRLLIAKSDVLPKYKKKIIYSILILLVVIISLRFGSYIITALAILFPVIFRILNFALGNFRILNYLAGLFGSKSASTKASNIKVSKKQAREILGVKDNASQDEIMKRYKSVMKNVHPDKGGSVYLASLVNQAKDKLMGK